MLFYNPFFSFAREFFGCIMQDDVKFIHTFFNILFLPFVYLIPFLSFYYERILFYYYIYLFIIILLPLTVLFPFLSNFFHKTLTVFGILFLCTMDAMFLGNLFLRSFSLPPVEK